LLRWLLCPYFFTPLFSQIIATSHLQPPCHPLRKKIEIHALLLHSCKKENALDVVPPKLLNTAINMENRITSVIAVVLSSQKPDFLMIVCVHTTKPITLLLLYQM
jgi:hypothetical protein